MKIIKKIVIEMEPFGYVRLTRKGRFSDKGQEYHDKIRELRLRVGSDKKEIIETLIKGNYNLWFFHKMPKSWSEKEKKKRIYTPKQTTPDGDNLFKAFVDTLFYKSGYNDSRIWYPKCRKYYGETNSPGFIVFEILDEIF